MGFLDQMLSNLGGRQKTIEELEEEAKKSEDMVLEMEKRAELITKIRTNKARIIKANAKIHGTG